MPDTVLKPQSSKVFSSSKLEYNKYLRTGDLITVIQCQSACESKSNDAIMGLLKQTQNALEWRIEMPILIINYYVNKFPAFTLFLYVVQNNFECVLHAVKYVHVYAFYYFISFFMLYIFWWIVLCLLAFRGYFYKTRIFEISIFELFTKKSFPRR